MNRVNTDAIRAAIPISIVASRYTKLRQRGKEMIGRCPFHEERTPSFHVNDSKGLYNCFGCGAHGDVIRLVGELEGLPFLDAVNVLGADMLERPAAVLHAAVQRDDAERKAKRDDARAIWDRAMPAVGTLAETYCRSRGIVSPLPASIRFGVIPIWRDYETAKDGPSLPAMICAAQDASDNVVGIQRIFLNDDGSGKADMKAPKRSLGDIRGCALRLSPAAKEIVICEGPEDGLTLMQALPDVPVWVAFGTSMLPRLWLPDTVETVVIAGDNNSAGREASDAAARAYANQGRRVRKMFPAACFSDFNDELRGVNK